MTHIKNMRVTENITDEQAREHFQEALPQMTPEFDPIDMGSLYRVAFEIFDDGVVAFLYDPFGCIVAMGELVL